MHSSGSASLLWAGQIKPVPDAHWGGPITSVSTRARYNGTSCGLNDVLWALRFGLPMVKQTLSALLAGYCQCDLDVGEQFLNFHLHMDLREYSAVDVRGVRSLVQGDQEWEDEQGPGPFECWERN